MNENFNKLKDNISKVQNNENIEKLMNNENVKKIKSMGKKKLIIIGVGIIVVIILLVCIFSGGNISKVKKGHLNAYPSIEIEDAFENFCNDCDWKEDGDDVVVFSGTSKETGAKMTVRFKIKNDDLTIKSMNVDGETSTNEVDFADILEAIYEKYTD